jgi:predicted CoA-binding protein
METAASATGTGMETTERILRSFRTIAVVGLSRHPSKAAHAIPARMQQAGFRVIPVNPALDASLGEKAYARLADVPFSVEVVLVFRPSAEAAGIARQAVAIGAKALWLQQGIVSAEAKALAEGAGLLYVEDRCMGVERAVHGITKA